MIFPSMRDGSVTKRKDADEKVSQRKFENEGLSRDWRHNRKHSKNQTNGVQTLGVITTKKPSFTHKYY